MLTDKLVFLHIIHINCMCIIDDVHEYCMIQMEEHDILFHCCEDCNVFRSCSLFHATSGVITYTRHCVSLSNSIPAVNCQNSCNTSH